MNNNTKELLGKSKYNNQGCLMKIIKYDNYRNIIVEFQDDYKAKVKTNLDNYKKGKVRNPNYRLSLKNINNQGIEMIILKYTDNGHISVIFTDEFNTVVQTNWRSFSSGNVRNPNYRKNVQNVNNKGYIMKCVEYISYGDIIVEFQDKYKAKVHTSWQKFMDGKVKNPYAPSVKNVGIPGNKYPISLDNKNPTKEYNIWNAMINRCYDEKFKIKNPTYKNIICCDEWLLYDNFYEWLHSQENFDKWYNNECIWSLDKDILKKNNKVYSPENCILVPIYINSLFTKNNKIRGDLPIGVTKNNKSYGYSALTIYGKNNNNAKITRYCYQTIEEAFMAYKISKEHYIRQIAQEEYNKCNITKRCYEAMMNYKVEITD